MTDSYDEAQGQKRDVGARPARFDDSLGCAAQSEAVAVVVYDRGESGRQRCEWNTDMDAKMQGAAAMMMRRREDLIDGGPP